MRPILSSLAAVLAITAAPLLSHAASEEPQVMVIMDSSGSMKRRIGARSKMEIAQDAVSRFVLDAPSDVPIGLMAYGRRRAKDCSDIEVMIPPSPGTGTRIEQAVDGMTPKGETPIAASLRAAADYMQAQTRTATVVLVTDGEEACNADPCAAAKELEAANVEFTTHVVGFGLNEEQSKAVKCLADNTGGRFIAADDAATLAAALVRTVAEPEPAPVVRIADTTVWFDNFEGDRLGEEWSVSSEDPDSYVLDGGELISINQSGHKGPSGKGAPNEFRAQVDLPSGDWDLTVTGRLEFSTGKDALYLGLSDEKGNGIYAIASTYTNGCGFNAQITTRQYKDYAKKAEAAKKYAGACKPGFKNYAAAAGEFAKKTTNVTLSKRGRKYSARIDNGPYGEQGETSTLTLLRVPKTITLGAWKYGNANNDTVINLDSISLRGVN